MDLNNLTIHQVEKGINKSISLSESPRGKLPEGADVLCEIYGFMICYELKDIDLMSYVTNNNNFSQDHIDAVQKYCS